MQAFKNTITTSASKVRDGSVTITGAAASFSSNVTTAGRDVSYITKNVTILQGVAEEKLDWIPSIDFKAVQTNICSKVTPGSGSSLFASPRYREWRDSQSETILHFIGALGTGKTYLASAIIDDIQKQFRNDKSTVVLYAYCQKRQNHTVPVILGSLLRQLAEQRSELRHYLHNNYYDWFQKADAGLTENEYIDIFKGLLKRPELSKVFLVIDGTEELEEASCRNLVNALVGLTSDSVGLLVKVHLLVTSRDSHVLQEPLKSAKPYRLEVSHDEINSYVVRSLRRDEQIRLLFRDDSEFEKKAIKTIAEKYKELAYPPSYLLVSLQLRHLKLGETATIDTFSQAMERIPNTIEALYDLTFAQIENSDRRELAERVLLWVANSFCPLTLTQLSAAVNHHGTTCNASTTGTHQEDELVSSCLGLLTVNTQNSVVEFIHLSARQSYNDRHKSERCEHHAQIASTCINFLSHEPNFHTCKSVVDLRSRRTSDSFFAYAYDYVGQHAREAQSTLPTDVKDFIKAGSFPIEDKQKIKVVGATSIPLIVLDILDPIHMAAAWGLPDIVSDYIPSVNAKTSTIHKTALHIACHQQDIATVNKLLTCPDVDIYACDGNNRSAFFHASSTASLLYGGGYDHSTQISVLEKLLARADKAGSAKSSELETALLSLFKNLWRSWPYPDCEKVLDHLLKRVGNTIPTKGTLAGRVLYCAAREGYSRGVQQLLDWGVDVNSDPFNETALIIASKLGHTLVVKELLQGKNLDLDKKDSNGASAMDHAVAQGHPEIAEILRGAGIKQASLKSQLSGSISGFLKNRMRK